MKRRGQVSVWVILAVILVATIVLIFLLLSDSSMLRTESGESVLDAQSFLSPCIEQSVNEAVDIMIPHGGFVNPRNYATFDGLIIEYHCDTLAPFEQCIQQHPMLLNEIKEEIRSYIAPRMEKCFEEMVEEFEARGGDVEVGSDLEVEVELDSDRVIVNLDRDLTLTRKREVRKFESVRFTVENPVYNLALVAMEIAAEEAEFCYFEFVGYGLVYPRYEIQKYTLSNPTKIYRIKDKKSGKEMNIAIRSCGIAPGY